MPGSTASCDGRLQPAVAMAGRAAAVVAAGPAGFAVAAGSAVHLLSQAGNGNGSPPATTLLPLPPTSVSKPIAALAATRDGTLVAAGERGSKPALWLWGLSAAVPADVQAPAQEVAKALHSFSIAALAFSPTGETEDGEQGAASLCLQHSGNLHSPGSAAPTDRAGHHVPVPTPRPQPRALHPTPPLFPYVQDACSHHTAVTETTKWQCGLAAAGGSRAACESKRVLMRWSL